jgi:hypothetical protein
VGADSSKGVTIPDAVDTGVCAPDDGWKYHPKHVEQFPEINKLCNVESCWIYIGILLAHPILHISRIRVKHATNMMAGPKFRLGTFQIEIRSNAFSSNLLAVCICGLVIDAICKQFCVGSEVWIINCKESGDNPSWSNLR